MATKCWVIGLRFCNMVLLLAFMTLIYYKFAAQNFKTCENVCGIRNRFNFDCKLFPGLCEKVECGMDCFNIETMKCYGVERHCSRGMVIFNLGLFGILGIALFFRIIRRE